MSSHAQLPVFVIGLLRDFDLRLLLAAVSLRNFSSFLFHKLRLFCKAENSEGKEKKTRPMRFNRMQLMVLQFNELFHFHFVFVSLPVKQNAIDLVCCLVAVKFNVRIFCSIVFYFFRMNFLFDSQFNFRFLFCSIIVSVIPQTCKYKGRRFECGLSISCVLAGGKPIDSCSGGMIWSCCVDKELHQDSTSPAVVQNASEYIFSNKNYTPFFLSINATIKIHCQREIKLKTTSNGREWFSSSSSFVISDELSLTPQIHSRRVHWLQTAIQLRCWTKESHNVRINCPNEYQITFSSISRHRCFRVECIKRHQTKPQRNEKWIDIKTSSEQKSKRIGK